MRDGPASLNSSLLARKGQARPAALPDDDIMPYVDADAIATGEAAGSAAGRASGAARLAAAAKRASAAPDSLPEAALTEVKVNKPRRATIRPAETLTTEPLAPPAPAAGERAPETLPAVLPSGRGLPAVARAGLQARPSRRLWRTRWRSHWAVFGLSFAVGAGAAIAYWLSQTAVPPATREFATPVELAQIPAPAAAPVAASLPQVRAVGFTDAGRPLVSGTAAPGGRLLLLDNGRLLASLEAGADGTWSFAGSRALAAGPHDFTVAAVAGTVAASVPATASAAPAAGAPDLSPGAVVLPAEKPARPEAADEEQASAAAGGGSDYVVQLASLPSEAAADRFWRTLISRNPRLMKGRSMELDGATLSDGSAVYRVRTGALSSLDEAQRLCRRFRSVRQDCLVVKRLESRS